MKKGFKIFILTFALLVTTLFSNVSAANYKEVDSFPNKFNIGDARTAAQYSVNWFNFIGTSDYATFCTMWDWNLPSNRTCNIINSGVYSWDDATKAGVAYIIEKANANNNDMSEAYYYGLLAINYFLYDVEGAETGNNHNDAHITTYKVTPKELLGGYYSWYTGAKKVYNDVSKLKNGKATLKFVNAIDSNGVHYTKTSLDLGQSNINTVTYKFTVDGPFDNYTLKANLSWPLAANVTVNGQTVSYSSGSDDVIISDLKKNDEVTVVFDNMATSTIDRSLTLSLSGTKIIKTAANYSCGDNYQNVTPNMIKTETKSASTSTKINLIKGVNKPKLRVIKVDAAGNKIEGAKISVFDSLYKDTYIETTNIGGVAEFVGLEDGDYCINEIQAPSGYLKSDINRCFSIDEDYNVTTNDANIIIDQNNKIITTTIENNKSHLSVAKVNKDGNLIKGAGLKLVSYENAFNDNWDAYVLDDGTTLEWESDIEPKVIEGLPVGGYYLVETYAPSGYVKNEVPQLIIFNGINQDNYFTFENEEISVVISKVDITTKEELPGATLRILDQDGNVVVIDGEELVWVSTEEQKVIKKLPAGTYYLEETQAPVGYAKMTEKIKFSLDEYGKVTIDESTDDGSVVIMTNAHTKVYISKQDITTKEELPGATLKLLDETGNIVRLNGEELVWVSTSEPHYIEGLPAGRTYTLVEETAPDGYSLNTESVTFTINEDGTITGDTVMYNTPIPDVPNTLSTKSILITLGGVAIIGLGIGLYLNGFKKKEEV